MHSLGPGPTPAGPRFADESPGITPEPLRGKHGRDRDMTDSETPHPTAVPAIDPGGPAAPPRIRRRAGRERPARRWHPGRHPLRECADRPGGNGPRAPSTSGSPATPVRRSSRATSPRRSRPPSSPSTPTPRSSASRPTPTAPTRPTSSRPTAPASPSRWTRASPSRARRPAGRAVADRAAGGPGLRRDAPRGRHGHSGRGRRPRRVPRRHDPAARDRRRRHLRGAPHGRRRPARDRRRRRVVHGDRLGHRAGDGPARRARPPRRWTSARRDRRGHADATRSPAASTSRRGGLRHPPAGVKGPVAQSHRALPDSNPI